MDARCHLVPCKVVFKTVRKYIQEKSHTMFKLAYKLLKKMKRTQLEKKKKLNLEMVKLEEKVKWKSLFFNNALVFLSPYILPSHKQRPWQQSRLPENPIHFCYKLSVFSQFSHLYANLHKISFSQEYKPAHGDNMWIRKFSSSSAHHGYYSGSYLASEPSLTS